MNCRFVSTTEPRVIAGRHLDPCACDDRQLGCWPCTETHCVVCSKAHAKAACTVCLDAARNDLKAIWDLCAYLPEEAAVKGTQSEAMMLLGPASDPEAWRNRATSAMVGRLDASYLEDCRDELHPLWVLGTWEQVWRDHLDHFSIATATVASAHAYLDMQIGYMSEQIEPPFDEFARELRGCRTHLENVLHDGIREERGAPCVQCEKPMIRTDGYGDVAPSWRCRTCRREVTEDQYRFAVGAAYRAHSPNLTAADMALQIGVRASVIRVWAVRGHVRKRGKSHEGLTLYDVADAIAKRDSPEEQAG